MTQSNVLRTWRKLSVHIAARALMVATMSASCDWVSTTHAADWPQWQGPNRNAMANEQGLLKEWPTGTVIGSMFSAWAETWLACKLLTARSFGKKA